MSVGDIISCIQKQAHLQTQIILNLMCPHFALGGFSLTRVGCLWVCWLVWVRDVEIWWPLKRAGIWHRL